MYDLKLCPTKLMPIDLIGDKYNGSSSSIVPDNDPLDNCSAESHGIDFVTVSSQLNRNAN